MRKTGVSLRPDWTDLELGDFPLPHFDRIAQRAPHVHEHDTRVAIFERCRDDPVRQIGRHRGLCESGLSILLSTDIR